MKPIIERFEEMAAEIFDQPEMLIIKIDYETAKVYVKMLGTKNRIGFGGEQWFSKLFLQTTDEKAYQMVKQDFEPGYKYAFDAEKKLINGNGTTVENPTGILG